MNLLPREFFRASPSGRGWPRQVRASIVAIHGYLRPLDRSRSSSSQGTGEVGNAYLEGHPWKVVSPPFPIPAVFDGDLRSIGFLTGG
jgi:hypothetical protein